MSASDPLQEDSRARLRALEALGDGAVQRCTSG